MAAADTIYDHQVRVKKVMLYINRNLDENCNLEQFSDIAYLSPYHFLRVFLAMMGETPQQYTTRKRMERAGYLLMKKQLRITDIAHQIGYQTSSSFCKVFKVFSGMNPRRYRDSVSESWLLKTNRSFLPVKKSKICSIPYQQPKVVVLPDLKIVYVENRGIVDASFKTSSILSFKKLQNLIVEKELTEKIQCLVGIYPFRFFDLEDKNAINYCGAIVSDEKRCLDSFNVYHVPTGRYAVFLHHGPFEFLMQTWNQVYLSWFPRSRLILRDSAPFELYLKNSPSNNPLEPTAQIYLPII